MSPFTRELPASKAVRARRTRRPLRSTPPRRSRVGRAPMSAPTEHAGEAGEMAEQNVTPELLKEWCLPDPGADKKSRGDVVVIGGTLRTPGGVMLAGEATMRVGAGRLGVLAAGPRDAQDV